MRRPWTGLVAGVLALFGTGCLVQIDHVANPGQHFREARAEAERYQGRPGPAHELNVLAYDPGDHQMVRVSVPMWLARKLEHHIDKDDLDFDFGDAETDARVRRRLNRLSLRDIEKAGLGILAEVEEGDGERVLVWLR